MKSVVSTRNVLRCSDCWEKSNHKITQISTEFRKESLIKESHIFIKTAFYYFIEAIIKNVEEMKDGI